MLLDAQMLSINSWAMCMREFPRVEAGFRHRYYVVFASSILLAAVAGTLLGYHGGVLLPAPLLLGLIFVSPLFFALVLSAVPGRAERVSMLLGCATIPLAHALWPAVDLLITGVVGGSLGFAVGQWLERRDA
jgi:predicted branched-subunit amino acid permease